MKSILRETVINKKNSILLLHKIILHRRFVYSREAAQLNIRGVETTVAYKS